MYNVRKIKENLYWVGANDRNLPNFERIIPIPRGVSYNSYILLDEKNVLFDTMDASAGDLFFENIAHVLNGKPLDYLVVHHVEPDHASNIHRVMETYPEAVLVCTAKAAQMIKQFFGNGFESRMMAVKEGDTLLLGKHNLTFVLAPMVHWPEVMVSYETTEKILFSADAFGTFGALYGPMFADEMNFDRDWLDDARRYYTNIVGKYGMQVQMLLNKAAGLEISLLCPLHGPMWRENIGYFIDKYQKWSTYTPESEGVLIVYASMYGHTENMAEIFASKINEAGVKELAVYNLSHTDCSYMIADAFKYSRILLVAPTYNNGLNPLMENFLHELAARFIQKRTFAIAENGTWMPASGKIMRSIVEEMKNCTVLEPTFTIKSALHPEQLSDMDTFINQFIHN